MTLMPPSVVCAQSQTEIKDADPSGSFEIVDTAPVVVNGRVRFHVIGVSAYPAERRAREIARRIEALAQDPTFDAKTLRVEDAGAYHQIFAGESRKPIFRILEADQGLILHTLVGIGYDVPWRQVEAMLLLAAERTEGFLKEPKPFIRHKSLGDFAVNYELNAYCGDASQMNALYTEMHRNIQDAFNENGVQIMSPAYEADPAEPKVVPKEWWYTQPANEPG